MKSKFSIVFGLAAIVLAGAACAKADVVLPSGVVVKHLSVGTGLQPKPNDTVLVHYRGTLASGQEFDSSYGRGMAASFPLSRVIPCWTEGLGEMRVGGKAKLTCPPATAYGSRGAGNNVPPNATLTFEVQLLNVTQATN